MRLQLLIWHKCKDKLPPNPKGVSDIKEYLCKCGSGAYMNLSWNDGWNCSFNKDNEIKNVTEWANLPR